MARTDIQKDLLTCCCKGERRQSFLLGSKDSTFINMLPQTPSLAMTASNTTQIEAALLQTVTDLQIRSEIQDCLAEIVTDVEIAVQLDTQLTVHSTVTELRLRLQQQERALEEARAVQKERCHTQSDLADALVQELWALSQEMGALQLVKEEHEKLVVDYNEVSARLFQTEEDLHEAQHQVATAATRQRSGSRQYNTAAPAAEENTIATATATGPSSSVDPTPSVQVKTEPTPTIVNLDAPVPKTEESADTTEQDAVSKDEEAPVATATAAAASAAAIANDNETSPVATETPTNNGQAKETAEPATEPAAVVLLDEDDEESDHPSFEKLDTKIIMNIFGFLDALDILNTAQVSISMYSRVDSLFGLGGGGGGGGGDDSSTIATTETPTTAASTAEPFRSTTAITSSNSNSNPKPVAVATTSAIKSSYNQGASSRPASVSTATATNPSSPPFTSSTASATMSRGAAGLFSLLQPRISKPSYVASPTRGGGGSVKRSNSQDGPQPMNAAMANSMAAKLTDGELNAIILMTERLKQKENLAEKLVKQNAELAAKLDGTEAVKQFLIGKVRDMEIVQAAAEDNETKVAQQIGSDQEVIAFLDGRVQELEGDIGRLVAEKEKAITDLQAIKVLTDKKAAVMGDMLQFERERLSENEREWKATKKLLVKEVKSCRAQILSLQAERDGYREQNEVLRKAVLSPGHGGAFGRDRAFT